MIDESRMIGKGSKEVEGGVLRHRPLAGSLLLVALMAATACVSNGKYQLALQERDDLAGRKSALEAQYAESVKRGEALAQEKESLSGEKATLEEQVRKMQADAAGLGSQLAQREKEAQQMKDTYDSLVGKLQGELSAGQVQIQRLKDGINVNVAQEILFASGSAVVDTKGREVLGRVSDQLKQVPYQVLVVGHTDNLMIGPGIAARYPTNWELGGARAASVVRLFQDSGIDGKRLLAISAGPHQPVASNDTPEGRARNRRIEIRLRPVVVEEEMQKPS